LIEIKDEIIGSHSLQDKKTKFYNNFIALFNSYNGSKLPD